MPHANSNLPLIVVSGPTAAGKSGLAVKLAQDLDGEILSVDSVQVYQKADIGSAKISKNEMKGVRHHLLDVVSPSEQYNLARYLEDAEKILASLGNEGKACIAAGGTTLYLKGLMHGIAGLPEGDPQTRARLEQKSSEELFAMLREEDRPLSEAIHPNDRMRMVRALETKILSGQAASLAHGTHRFQSTVRDALILVICLPRDELYRRIGMRTGEMLNSGLIEETKLIAEKFGNESPVLGTVGYKQVMEYLEGRIAREDLAEGISKFTRRFAKRQMTFWRNEPLKRNWRIRPVDGEDAITIGTEGGTKKKSEVRKGFRVLRLSYDQLWSELESYCKEGSPGISLWYLDASELHN